MRKFLWVSFLLLCCSLFISCKSFEQGFDDVMTYMTRTQKEKDMERIKKDPEYVEIIREMNYSAERASHYRTKLASLADPEIKNGEFTGNWIARYAEPAGYPVENPVQEQKEIEDNYEWRKKEIPILVEKKKYWSNRNQEIKKKRDAFVERKLKEFEEERKRRAKKEDGNGGNGGNGGGGY